eukprot:CAMPEP_0205915032 /NCGR_PEP_ID=MMETSP1325-20131115/7596_1 /ASSEMBLY_ACC=CAM_ASM_000708 /TAXON_ID=236786 /ORGANISM="Florenciella sp., Strain RCC1007" /LENGTH=179 /DNA_ID=CAMNT_0053282153 /DNA_START=49 /DNA_END=588 /DNA_ORIENTATION=+
MWRTLLRLLLVAVLARGADSRKERARDLKQTRQEELEETLEKIKHRHGSADGTVDVAQLPPEVAEVHASATAELSAINANRLVKVGSQLYTHANSGDAAQPRRRRRSRDKDGSRAKSRGRIGRLSRDVTEEELEEEEVDDRFSKVPEPSWSKRNRRKRKRRAKARAKAQAQREGATAEL